LQAFAHGHDDLMATKSPDLLESDRPVRWGIMATGGIAHSFATDLALVPDAELVAAGSRRQESAEEFATKYGGTAYGSYEQLLADPQVDVVYVATPHGRHVDDVRACFAAGKHVLCEKALTLSAASAAALVEEARAADLFFCEAMWMRTNPRVLGLLAAVRDGAVGEVRTLRADLGFVAPYDPSGRLWDPALGASALLDVGIYPLTFAYAVLGAPEGVAAAGVLSDRGIDVRGGATLTYASGAVATLSWSQTSWTDNRAAISGPDGRIDVPPRMHQPPSWSLTSGAEAPVEHSEEVLGSGYAHEILEVGRCLRAGLRESPLIPLDETVAIMALMDVMREQMGVVLPED
jgi:predicted dehydrogenase